MSGDGRPSFSGGVNIAMKIPKADYEATVAFYRDVLGLDMTEEEETGTPSVSRTFAVRFGPTTLWLDCVDGAARSDLWLELRTDDLEAATRALAESGHSPCDEVEPFADPDARAHWIRNPAGVVHLLAQH
ncbi:VOC family protein [Nocardiopsis sp. CNT-189]|uniref:VOC family protein n=1 Tax=Nocardiopsis oceanisediminis TaxID=2816862 RepID=UPI003B2C7614